jgi:Lar family restriction alleviation protein
MAAAQMISSLMRQALIRPGLAPCFLDRRGRLILGTPEPQPCPFCGTAHDLILTRNGHVGGKDHDSTFYVTCESCDAVGPLAGSRREAARLWNKLGVTEESRLQRLLFGPGEA